MLLAMQEPLDGLVQGGGDIYYGRAIYLQHTLPQEHSGGSEVSRPLDTLPLADGQVPEGAGEVVVPHKVSEAQVGFQPGPYVLVKEALVLLEYVAELALVEGPLVGGHVGPLQRPEEGYPGLFIQYPAVYLVG